MGSDNVYNINEGLVIAPNHLKKEILKKISKEKKLLNLKVMTKEEFIKEFYGTYKKEALYFIMQKYNLNYMTAKEYLNNIFIKSKVIKPFYEILKKENLLKTNPNFKDNLKNITIIDYDDMDPYILEDLKKYNLKIVEKQNGNIENIVHEFNTQTEEIVFVAQNIIDKIINQNIDINDIFISGITNDYKSELIRIFNLFNIPFNFKKNISLYSAKITQLFLQKLNETRNIETALNSIPTSDLKNQIISTLNTIDVPQIDNTSIKIIEAEMQNITKENNEIKNAVQIINLNEIIDKSKHYYILGLNQGIIPHIYKDNSIIEDKEKEEIGMLTSLEKNKIAKQNIKYLIKTFPHLTISYKLKDTFNTYFPSSIINELNLKIIKEHTSSYKYSNNYNKLKLGIMLDNYFNYNQKDENLNLLYQKYSNLPYNTYDNQYKLVTPKLLKDSLKNGLTLSYTSLNNYALCPFKFYIKHILKLEPFEETFPLLIGNLFHCVLSHLYDANFDLKKEYYGYLKDKTLNHKEKFYIDKLYKILKEDIEIIKWQESKSAYLNHLTEKPVQIDKTKDINITFKGIIDKINYSKEMNKINAIIIDYKTGNITSTLDNINYGLNMQLPTYIYLVQKGLNENIEINGFYLQKVLTDISVDSKDTEKDFKKNLKLDGYTINIKDIINKIDNTYENSEIISSMKTTQNGFYAYAKIVNKDQINKIIEITENNIDNTIDNILNAKFQIEPKRIDGKNISCEFCPFKDICFVKENNIKNLKNTKFKDIIGGEENA